jgi:hypothetical protein
LPESADGKLICISKWLKAERRWRKYGLTGTTEQRNFQKLTEQQGLALLTPNRPKIINKNNNSKKRTSPQAITKSLRRVSTPVIHRTLD